MRGTSGETNMMHRQQRQSSTSLRFSSSRGNSANSSSSSLSSEYSSPLTILSRRCSSNRSRTSTTSTSAASPSTRCSSSTGATSLSSCPILLSVLAWSVTLLLISSYLGIADASRNYPLLPHPLSKRSFMQIQCKGIYDRSNFARLDRICEDCYNLFREPRVYVDCKDTCFTSNTFRQCLVVLLMEDEIPEIKKWIKQVHGADPWV